MIKCHTCQKELVNAPDTPKAVKYPWLECPALHVLGVTLNAQQEITGYMIYWDDIERDARYKLESRHNHTTMAHRPLLQPENRPMENISTSGFVSDIRPKRWSSVMEFPNFLPLTIKDDTIQIDNLIHRLLKLRAFS